MSTIDHVIVVLPYRTRDELQRAATATLLSIKEKENWFIEELLEHLVEDHLPLPGGERIICYFETRHYSYVYEENKELMKQFACRLGASMTVIVEFEDNASCDHYWVWGG